MSPERPLNIIPEFEEFSEEPIPEQPPSLIRQDAFEIVESEN